MSVFQDAKQLFHPYYFFNIILSISFLSCRLISPLCNYVFSGSDPCEISQWESQVLFFLLVIIMFRTRKSGSRTILCYIATASTYAKLCNIILWFSTDPILGVVYLILTLVHFLVVGKPVYGGPEKITYFRGQEMDEEIEQNKQIIWIIAYYTSWSPPCGKLAPIFSRLSVEYTLDNLKFGKVDVGRFPDVAKSHHINTTTFSVQLPTVSIFRNGKEVMRRPGTDSRGRFQPFYFTEDNIRAAFDLNNLYIECKKSLHPKKAVESNHMKED